MIPDQEIYNNRLKVIEFLKQPDLKKAKNMLDDGNGRCCLGHMCVAIGMKGRLVKDAIYYGKVDDVAPLELMEAVGLHHSDGATYSLEMFDIIGRHRSLASHNDNTDATPQQIAEYLESVIMGGVDTPWKAIRV